MTRAERRSLPSEPIEPSREPPPLRCPAGHLAIVLFQAPRCCADGPDGEACKWRDEGARAALAIEERRREVRAWAAGGGFAP